jgi:3-isopropylmalate dehydrogenase
MLIALFPGDGIGPEIIAQARRVLDALAIDGLIYEEGLVGGAAYKAVGHPLPPETLELAKRADAILFGAVGDPDCDSLERHLRPEQAILGLRKALGLFSNLRPAKVFPELADASALKKEVASAIDLLIVRETNGDVYFGEKGMRKTADGLREGYDIMSYNEEQVRKIAHQGFQAARARRGKLCSVDKANVLETSQLWRDVVIEVSAEYPDVALSHMYVDNAAMQLVRDPGQFDVIVTGNMFGDILSDQASMCVGSIGMLASATLNDIAGQGKANPLATVLSAGMMLRYSLGLPEQADRIEAAVGKALANGARSFDLGGSMNTVEMGDAVLAALV